VELGLRGSAGNFYRRESDVNTFTLEIGTSDPADTREVLQVLMAMMQDVEDHCAVPEFTYQFTVAGTKQRKQYVTPITGE